MTIKGVFKMYYINEVNNQWIIILLLPIPFSKYKISTLVCLTLIYTHHIGSVEWYGNFNIIRYSAFHFLLWFSDSKIFYLTKVYYYMLKVSLWVIFQWVLVGRITPIIQHSFILHSIVIMHHHLCLCKNSH